MKKNRPLIMLALIFSIIAANAQQISYFNQGFLRQQNAAQDLAWLGLNPSGSGSVTNFTAGNFSPLFTSTVTTPTTWPHLSFSPIGQAANLVYASPDGGIGFPSFRALTLADLPTLPTGGSVTNFSMGDLSPLFTTSVATSTTFPTVTLSLSTHANNTFLAGPNGGGPLAPTFRTIATGDLPDITSIVRGDVSATAPVLYDNTTGIFSMHVSDASHDGYLSSSDWSAFNSKQSALTIGNLTDAGTDGITVGSGSGAVIGSGTTISQHASDVTHNGYLSSADWSTFNSKGSGTVITITNSGVQSAGSTLVAASNAPVLGIKSVTGSGTVTVTDQGGTNLVFSGSSSAAGTDITMNNLSSYANNTNFNIDFNFGASTLNSSNDIAFNYSTNWGLSSTSRVCNVYIPATNYLRYIYFINAATNWHPTANLTAIPPMRGAKLTFQLYGVGETNVSMLANIDSQNAAALPQVYNLANVTTGTNILLLDAALNGLYDDHLLTVPSQDGQEVRGWKDASGMGNNVTNFTTIYNGLSYRSAMTAPFNIPCLQMGFSSSANTWLKSAAISKLTQPITVFFLYHSFNTVMTTADGATSATSARMACQASIGGSVVLASQNSSSIAGSTSFTPNYLLFTYVFNGASSTIRTNAAAVVSGSVANVTPTSLTMFSDISSTQPQTIGYIPEIQIWWGALSTADRGNIETNYFRAKYRNW